MTAKDPARMAANEIERDINARNGLGGIWRAIDCEVRDQIRDGWAGIIRKHFGLSEPVEVERVEVVPITRTVDVSPWYGAGRVYSSGD